MRVIYFIGQSGLHFKIEAILFFLLFFSPCQTGDADSSRAPGLTAGSVTDVVIYCWCHSDSASVLLYFTFLSNLFPLPCGPGSTFPPEGFDSSVIMPFSWCVVAVTLPI